VTWTGFWFLGFLALVAGICSAYWFGKDAGSREAFKWRTRYEHQRRENSLLRQMVDAPPYDAWNNVRIVPDESCSRSRHPSGYSGE
jgi:hypothetical protein